MGRNSIALLYEGNNYLCRFLLSISNNIKYEALINYNLESQNILPVLFDRYNIILISLGTSDVAIAFFRRVIITIILLVFHADFNNGCSNSSSSFPVHCVVPLMLALLECIFMTSVCPSVLYIRLLPLWKFPFAIRQASFIIHLPDDVMRQMPLKYVCCWHLLICPDWD